MNSINSIKISMGNSKLGKAIPSVNLPPIITCRKDAPCAKSGKCYACKGRFRFKNVQNTMRINYELWKSNPKAYEKAIIDVALMYSHFRFHSAGDIPEAAYLNMMCNVAMMCPNTKFLAFTKQYEIVNDFFNENVIPDNLTIVFSAWNNEITFDNPHGFPVAYVRLKHVECDIPANAIECSGFCGDCVNTECNCWDMKRNVNDCVVFNEH